MEYIVKKKLYHNTLGLLNEGETVTFTKEEVAEYDKDYFDTLFENYTSGMKINSLLAGQYFGLKQDYIVV